jgi:hypothetical protein
MESRRKTTSLHCKSTRISIDSTSGFIPQLVSFTYLFQTLIRQHFTSYASRVAINTYFVKIYLLPMHRGS